MEPGYRENGSGLIPALGEIALLMSQSEVHRSWSVDALCRLVIPPLANGTHAGIQNNGRLVAWASWAFLNDQAVQGFVGDTRLLHPHDWESGQNIWLIDVVAPFGHAWDVTRLARQGLRNNGFQGQHIHFKRTKGRSHRFGKVMI